MADVCFCLECVQPPSHDETHQDQGGGLRRGHVVVVFLPPPTISCFYLFSLSSGDLAEIGRQTADCEFFYHIII